MKMCTTQEQDQEQNVVRFATLNRKANAKASHESQILEILPEIRASGINSRPSLPIQFRQSDDPNR
jgi:hypothetical protein